MYEKTLRCMALLLIVFAAFLTNRASAQPLPATGVDLVVLVDVSTSMYSSDPRSKDEEKRIRTGNDWQRLRWDAVKLIVDLLTDEDRILILPFNDGAPPKALYEKDVAPGFSGHFEPVRDAKIRDNLESSIFDLTSSDETVSKGGKKFYIDAGMTGIIGALNVARERSIADRETLVPGSKRETVVFLLTDGVESEAQKELTKEDGETDAEFLRRGDTYVNQRFRETAQSFEKLGIPIFSFGLGENVSTASLAALAAATLGSHQSMRDSREMVEEFRSLIWSLKGHWVWHVDEHLTAGESKTLAIELHEGLIDFGVLCYEVDPGRLGKFNSQRTTFPPSPAPRLVWSQPLSFNPLDRIPPRTGKTIIEDANPPRPTGYSYFYFDGREKAADPPGAIFRRSPAGAKMEAVFTNVPNETHVYAMKRTTEPKFHIEFVTPPPFYRHQPIPLRVVMDDSSRFRPQDFDLVVELSTVDTTSQTVTVPLQLSADGGSRGPWQFVDPSGNLSAASLPRTAERWDACTLTVTVRGNEERKHGLSPFQTVLPPRTIQIENAIPLDHQPAAILLEWAKRNSQEVSVQTKYPFADDLLLGFSATFPALQDAGSAAVNKHFDFAGPGLSADKTQLHLRMGKASLRCELDEANPPPVGLYTPGRMRFVSRNPLWPVVDAAKSRSDPTRDSYEVPYHVRVGTVGLVLNSEDTALVVGPQASRANAAIRLATEDENEVNGGPLTVSLRPIGESTRKFSERELWIQPADQVVRSTAERTQLLSLVSPQAKLQVFFEPDPAAGRALIGYHEYEIVTEGTRYDSARLALSAIVEPPEVALRQQEVKLYSQPGGAAAATLEARVKWLEGCRYPFTIEPRDELALRSINDATRVTPPLQVRYTGPRLPIVLAVPKPNPNLTPAWTQLPFTLHFPEDSPSGIFRGKLSLMDEDRSVAELSFGITLNRMRLSFPVYSLAVRESFPAVPEPAEVSDAIHVLQFFDHATTRTMLVENQLGHPMSPEHLKVRFLSDDLSAGNDKIRRPEREIRNLQGVVDSLLVDLNFSNVRHGNPGVPYHIDVMFEYRDEATGIDLGSMKCGIDVTIVDPKSAVHTRQPN